MLLECCKAQVGLPQQAEGIQHNVPAEHDINAIISQIAKNKRKQGELFCITCHCDPGQVTEIHSPASLIFMCLFN